MSDRWVMARDPREGEFDADSLDEPVEDRYTEGPAPATLFTCLPPTLPLDFEAHAMHTLTPPFPECLICEDTHMIDVTWNSDPTNSVPMICDQCEGGRDLARVMRERDDDDGA